MDFLIEVTKPPQKPLVVGEKVDLDETSHQLACGVTRRAVFFWRSRSEGQNVRWLTFFSLAVLALGPTLLLLIDVSPPWVAEIISG